LRRPIGFRVKERRPMYRKPRRAYIRGTGESGARQLRVAYGVPGIPQARSAAGLAPPRGSGSARRPAGSCRGPPRLGLSARDTRDRCASYSPRPGGAVWRHACDRRGAVALAPAGIPARATAGSPRSTQKQIPTARTLPITPTSSRFTPTGRAAPGPARWLPPPEGRRPPQEASCRPLCPLTAVHR
jgi:hypothetical protein